MMRFRSSAQYGLVGAFNPLREELARVFKEDDRQSKEFEEWEWKRRSREESKKKSVAPVVETVSETDQRIIKRSHSDGIERVCQ